MQRAVSYNGSNRMATAAKPWSSTSTDVMFLGAGFSRALSKGKAPLMGTFFDELDDREYWTLSKFLSECFGSPRQANVEEAILRLEQLAVAPFTASIDAFIGQCRKRYTEVCRELNDYTLIRLSALECTERWVDCILSYCSQSTTVITTNYDNLAERILSNRPNLRHHIEDTNCHHCKMCQIISGSGIASRVDPDPIWKGALLKLHGSIAWTICSNADCTDKKCMLPDKHCAPAKDGECERCGNKYGPALVLPSMVKKFEALPGIHRMWDSAFSALQQARQVLFFGFSIPSSDAVIAEMIRCTLGRSQLIERIGVMDVNPDAPIERLRKILPNERSIQIDSFPVLANGEVPLWYGDWIKATGLELRAEKGTSA